MEEKLVRRYHQTLLAGGVEDYRWETVLERLPLVRDQKYLYPCLAMAAGNGS